MGRISEAELKAIWAEMVMRYQPKIKAETLKAMYADWKKDCSGFHADAVRRTWQAIKQGETEFPTLARFYILANETDSEISRKAEEAVKKEEERTARAFYGGTLATDDFGNAALLNIRLMLAGKTTRQQFLDGCKTLGINTAWKIAQHYQDHDLPMDKIAGSQYAGRVFVAKKNQPQLAGVADV